MSFVSYSPRPGIGSRTTSYVFDTNSLDDLRRQVSKGGEHGKQSELEVAKQFESLFIQMMLKQARAAGISGGLFHDEGTKMAQSMHDEQMSLELAQGKGFGLAQALMAMMQKGQDSQPADEAGQALAGNGKVASVRAPGMKSEMPLDKQMVADSLDGLIDLLTKGAQTLKRAASTVSRIIPSDTAPSHAASFIEKIGDAAMAAAKESGVPAELIMSQAALESGWGKREIKHGDGNTSHNLFGIKATAGWTGKVVHVMTTEYVNGVAQKVSQPFRAYDSYEDSLADYARLLSTSDRYSTVMQAPTPEQAAREVQRAGYATDPNYAQKLISIMGHFKTA